ncbi:MAG: LysM peptidoglycan-binding domain-containing protein [Gemmatimonadales bacterium]|nr:LysM peptidoglycan-binding domain-containing protein [Candidatus Palauibacter irciniicola]MYC17249.1 LysM peptidoglycan-binding domain-containing protein [Gemmatimonadales bacterium]
MVKTWTMSPRHGARSLRKWRPFVAVSSVLLATVLPGEISGQSLRGSTSSLDRQNRVARAHDFTYIATPAQIERFVNAGYLVRVPASADYVLHDLSFPYARPEVNLFISRLARQYRSACGERLVVTSLTRPKNKQPQNASPRSVHPTGMALDLRRPDPKCRGWLERVLLQLEGSGVLEATLERRPPHYHVAIFPQQYAAYVERITRAQQQYVAGGGRYEVRPGDSLWEIARRHATTVPRLRSANNLSGSRIYPGQVLTLPG